MVDYKKLRKEFNRSLMWQFLREKHEYKLNFAERGFQTIVIDNATLLAYKLKLNEDFTACLAYCKGGFFSGYGKAGLKTIMEYMKTLNINLSYNELALEFVKYDTTESFINLPNEFYEILKELFSDNPLNSSIEEVKLVSICYDIMEKIKPSMNISHNYFLELEEKCFKLLEEEILKNNKVVNVDVSHLIPNNLFIEENLSKNDKQDLIELLDYCIENDRKQGKDDLKTILESIETSYVKKTW